MKKQILGLALAALPLLSPAQKSAEKALLYKITGPGLAKPSYVFGTFHLVCAGDVTLSDATKKAVADTKQLFLEVDLDDPATMGKMQQLMMLPKGKTLKDIMSAADYATVNQYMQTRMGMGLAMLNGMKPVALMSMMYMTLLSCPPQSYDMTFAQMAAKDKKEVLGLESLETQMAVLDKIPLEEQVKGLVKMAKDPTDAQKEFAKLLAAYKAQDVAKLMKMMQASKFEGSTPEFEAALLTNRNRAWIPVIEKAAKAKPTFFAFGAGHLGGPTGVVTLLRKRGYTVKAIN